MAQNQSNDTNNMGNDLRLNQPNNKDFKLAFIHRCIKNFKGTPKRGSCRQVIWPLIESDNKGIQTQPKPVQQESKMVELEFLQKGGHAGFIIGNSWKNYGWIETRIPEFFKKQLDNLN